MDIKINIAGDFVLTSSYDSENIDPGIVKEFSDSDLNILNLECPITSASEKDKITKTGPYLQGDENAILNVLSTLKVKLVTMANNHIMDYGKRGLTDTFKFCEQNNIQYVGAGINLRDAEKPKRFNLNNKAVSIINFAENEWASASEDYPGANPMDIINNVNTIREEKKISEIVIVIIHGGHMYYKYPSPNMQKQYRFYAENGADLIACHHSHSISGHEIYKNVPIYYGLGNFIFTKESRFESWYTGFILQLTINVNGKLTTKLLPIKMTKDFHIRALTILEENQTQEEVAYINEVIEDPYLLKDKWEELIRAKEKPILSKFSPISVIPINFVKLLLNKVGIRLLSKKAMAYHLNFLRCEAHSDLSIEVINKYLKKTKA